MTWINITAADLKIGKASDLVIAYASSALGAGQADPTVSVIASVSERIRTEIQSCSQNIMSATTGAIPPSLKSLAIRMICWELQSRLNVFNAVAPSDQDQQDHRYDLRYLERIAMCKVVIETPADPIATEEVQRGSFIETVGDRPRQTGRLLSSRL